MQQIKFYLIANRSTIASNIVWRNTYFRTSTVPYIRKAQK